MYFCNITQEAENIKNTIFGKIEQKIEKIKKERIYKKDIRKDIKELIEKNRAYFLAEAIGTTRQVIINGDLEKLRSLGYPHRVAVDAFERYGIYIYVGDLADYPYTPKSVNTKLTTLLKKYGLERITEEVVVYLAENYSDKFGIKLVNNK